MLTSMASDSLFLAFSNAFWKDFLIFDIYK